MGSKEYWAERERAKQLKVDEVTDVEVEKVRDAISKAINSLDDEIHRIYMKYAVDNEMSYADTLKYLTNDERKEFQKDLQYYIEKNRDTEYVKKHAKELHSLSVRARVKRIEALMAKIKQHSADLEELLNDGTREQISSLYTEGYLRQTYELSGGLTPEKGKVASAFNTRAVRQILDTSWSGSNYSDKVWNITDSFTDKLQQTLTQGLIQGQHPDVIARNFRQYGFGKSGAGGLAYRAETLIRTEAANIIEQAQKEAYKDHKIKEYYFMTAKDQRVCDKCAPLNGKLFTVDEAAQGKNYPPMHPCCRCTTKAKTRFDDNDDEYYKLYEDDYDTWYKKYVEPELDKIDAESLTEDERRGLTQYVSSEAYVLNDKLRNGSTLTEKDKELIKNIDSGLEKLPKHEGIVNRLVYFWDDKTLKQFYDNHVVGEKISYSSYLSTTRAKCYNEAAQVQMYIDGISGANMDSIRSDEQEVLFGRNASFKVLKKIKKNGKYYIFLAEDE